jgi:hypothetical protein
MDVSFFNATRITSFQFLEFTLYDCLDIELLLSDLSSDF